MKYTAVFSILIALAALYLVFGHNGILKYREMVSIRESYEEKIRLMDEKLIQMEKELELAKRDKEYMESMIRRELGLQKEGEDLYIIGDNLSE